MLLANLHPPEIIIRSLSPVDSKAITEIQNQAYIKELQEDEAIFVKRIEYYPEGCWGAWIAQPAPRLIGYLISFPWVRDLAVPFNSMPAITENCLDCYYLHDLCLHPHYRKQGVGRLLLSFAIRRARQLKFPEFRLVSVQNSLNFWKRHGFLQEKQIAYGDGQKAFEMKCPLPSGEMTSGPH